VNQALMELGATLCLPFAAARCEECPWKERCEARARGLVERIPAKGARSSLLVQTWAVAIARRGGRFLVHRRDPAGLLHGMVELPTLELTAAQAREPGRVRAALASFLRRRFGARARVGAELLSHRQVVSNRKVTQRGFEVELSGRTSARARWLAPERIAELAVTTATRRILARLRGA
jgi:A/G-specific adenine glycosylase